jgi:DNA-binding GntR family transcriptional regulator
VRVRRLARDIPERLAASVAEHRLIAAAIAERDADLAAHATHVHLHNALATILTSVESSGSTVHTNAHNEPHTEQGAA